MMDGKSEVMSAAGLVARIDQSVLRGADGRKYKLAIVEQKPVRPRVGWLYAAIGVAEGAGAPSRTPLAMGIVSGGGRLVKPWMELRIYPNITMAGRSSFDARAAGLEAELINLIGKLIPPGGHLMIEYESPGQNQTHAELLLRVPPAASYLGSLMFAAGFRGAFKDWYISEGGHEGPRKLQANKSPDAKAARVALQEHRRELGEFLKRERPRDGRDAAILEPAQKRARVILKGMARRSL